MTAKTHHTRPLFVRLSAEPMLVPRPDLVWEAGGVFAPAVVKRHDGYHMLYRAFGRDRISRLGYATSPDGLEWRRHTKPRVIGEGPSEQYGLEDPRSVVIDGVQLTTYTAASGHQEADGWHWLTRINILSTRDNKTFVRLNPKMPNINNKDAVLFPRQINGKYFMLHRPEPDIWISSSLDLKRWIDHRRILTPVPGSWQDLRIGAGSPPIETEHGWLVFTHGVAADLTYCMSAVMLDLADPSIVTYRLPYPLLVPGLGYELRGIVPKVVFGTAVTDEGKTYRLYYGGADYDIAAAEINKADLIHALMDYPAITAPPGKALPA
ncbi:glycosidase [Candidatus Saccharibacteria bacterium]|nr:glycosidase [Candidatus Saccharibacteria bacterium]